MVKIFLISCVLLLAKNVSATSPKLKRKAALDYGVDIQRTKPPSSFGPETQSRAIQEPYSWEMTFLFGGAPSSKDLGHAFRSLLSGTVREGVQESRPIDPHESHAFFQHDGQLGMNLSSVLVFTVGGPAHLLDRRNLKKSTRRV
ncbi:hypothetical protein BR93DRAFT_471851 [Coniochaeta sp. PMI_546]|nr:hypothetical protein BR93DRAFT_471851 [Coniochaeta sp. PMI_546]